MTFPLGNILQFRPKVQYFDFWTVVTASAYTYSMTVAGTSGEVLYIDWGDGVKEKHTLIGGSLVITHDYGIGTFQQKWFVTKTAITTLAANTQRLSGELPLELQGFTSLVNFQIASNSFNTDISTNGWLTAFSSWVDLEFFYINSNQLTGAITAWDVSALANMRYFLIYGNLFSGDITSWDISGWTGIVYIYMYNMTSIQGDLTAWDLSACTLLQRLYLYNLDLSGSVANIGNENWLAISLNLMFGNSITGLNDYTITYFDNRVSYTASTKTINISDNSEYLTGTYQQPDLGTYTGDINDLTEAQITNLSNGLDYDGLGTNVVWSTLEKVWILENLDTTSSSGVKRYNFSFTYDSAISTLRVLNSGAKGTEYISDDVLNSGGASTTDWVDTNTDGLADNWTESQAGSYTPTIVTGNGFTGNAQRLLKAVTSGVRTVFSDLKTLTNGSNYILSLKIRSNTNNQTTIKVIDSASTDMVTIAVDVNTGNAEAILSSLFTANANQVRVVANVYASGDYVEIDEVVFLEVTGITDWVDTNTDGLADNYTDISVVSPTFSIQALDGTNYQAWSVNTSNISGIRNNNDLAFANSGVLSLRAGTITYLEVIIIGDDDSETLIATIPGQGFAVDPIIHQIAYNIPAITTVKYIKLQTDGVSQARYVLLDEIELLEV